MGSSFLKGRWGDGGYDDTRPLNVVQSNNVVVDAAWRGAQESTPSVMALMHFDGLTWISPTRWAARAARVCDVHVGPAHTDIVSNAAGALIGF